MNLISRMSSNWLLRHTLRAIKISHCIIKRGDFAKQLGRVPVPVWQLHYYPYQQIYAVVVAVCPKHLPQIVWQDSGSLQFRKQTGMDGLSHPQEVPLHDEKLSLLIAVRPLLLLILVFFIASYTYLNNITGKIKEKMRNFVSFQHNVTLQRTFCNKITIHRRGLINAY